MSQFFISASGGSTPAVETLTGNTGVATPVGNNINDKGLAANSGGNAFPVYSYGSTGNLQWENRAYLSPYVVDPSGTDGQKGTFTSVQAAVTQAIADGGTGTNFKTIFVRLGNYFDSITFPSDASINIVGLTPTESGQTGAIFQGQMTITGGSVNFFNIASTATGGPFIIQSGGSVFLENCTIGAQATAAYAGSGSAYAVCTNCTFGTITAQGSTNLSLYNCEVLYPNPIYCEDSSYVFCQGCLLYDIVLSSAATFESFYGIWYSGGDISGSSSSECYLYYNNFLQCATPAVIASATFSAAGNSAPDQILFASPARVSSAIAQQGNVKAVNIQAGDYTTTYNDQFIGATTSSAAPTITLVASPEVGLTQTISDISGNAATHNITVNGNGINIDGASTFVMNTNYGSLTFCYTGLIWKVI